MTANYDMLICMQYSLTILLIGVFASLHHISLNPCENLKKHREWMVSEKKFFEIIARLSYRYLQDLVKSGMYFESLPY